MTRKDAEKARYGSSPNARRGLVSQSAGPAIASESRAIGLHPLIAMRALLALLLALSVPVPAQDVRPTGHQHSKTLGTIVFPNSGNAAAQAPFLRGIALLHS